MKTYWIFYEVAWVIPFSSIKPMSIKFHPQIHSYSAAEAPGPLCPAPPATSPSSEASPPPRGLRQRPRAMEFGLGQPMPQRRAQCLKHIEIQEIHCRFELDWPKSTSPRFLTSSYLWLSFQNESVLIVLRQEHQGLKKDKSFESAERLHGTWCNMDQHGTISTIYIPSPAPWYVTNCRASRFKTYVTKPKPTWV